MALQQQMQGDKALGFLLAMPHGLPPPTQFHAHALPASQAKQQQLLRQQNPVLASTTRRLVVAVKRGAAPPSGAVARILPGTMLLPAAAAATAAPSLARKTSSANVNTGSNALHSLPVADIPSDGIVSPAPRRESSSALVATPLLQMAASPTSAAQAGAASLAAVEAAAASEEEWLRLNLGHTDAEEELQLLEEGEFLIHSTDDPHSDAMELTLVYDGACLTVPLVQTSAGQFGLGGSARVFSSLPLLVAHYQGESQRDLPISLACIHITDL